MATHESEGHNANPTGNGSTETSINSLQTEYTRFKLDILCILYGEVHYGLSVKDALEAYYDEDEVNHGRLYPNLDDLVEDGYIDKQPWDKRTNRYELTDAGREFVDERRTWVVAQTGGGED